MIKNYLRVAFRNRFGGKYRLSFIAGVYGAGRLGLPGGGAPVLVLYQRMAERFCLSDRLVLVDFRPGGRDGAGYCAGDGELSSDQGGPGQPGKKFKERIKIAMQHFSGTRVF
jgi:hypothetical protein